MYVCVEFQAPLQSRMREASNEIIEVIAIGEQMCHVGKTPVKH
jgi:hypothetical protein